MKKGDVSFDHVLAEVGEYGLYQRLVLWVVLVPCAFPEAFQMYNQLFMAVVPQHWCYEPQLSGWNITEKQKKLLRLGAIFYRQ